MKLEVYGWSKYMYRVQRHLIELYGLEYQMKVNIENGLVSRAWMVRNDAPEQPGEYLADVLFRAGIAE